MGPLIRRVALAAALLGCAEDPAPTQPPEETPPEVTEPGPGSEPEPEPEAQPEEPADLPAPEAAAPAALGAVPELTEPGCAFAAPAAIGPGEWGDVAASEGGFVAAVLHADEAGETLTTFRLDPAGGSAPLTERRLDHPVPPARRGAGPIVDAARVAWVDAERGLHVAPLEGGDPAPVGQPASLRFTPALVSGGEARAIAWTDDSGTPMRVRARRLGADGRPTGEAADLTPSGGGGAAPVAHGEGLVFLDPRAAMSVAHRASVGPQGFGEAAVARPVGLVTAPPQIAAIGEPPGLLAFTAVGAAATTAVGLVPLEGATPAQPIVRGTGYGTLHVDGDGRLLVADAPLDRPPESPRELHVHAVGADGALSEATVIRGPDGHARRGRIASSGELVAVLFEAAGRVYVSLGRCRP